MVSGIEASTSQRPSRRSSVISNSSRSGQIKSLKRRSSSTEIISTKNENESPSPERNGKLVIKSRSAHSDFIKPVSESIGIETMPIHTKDFSMQSMTQTREVSSQSYVITREASMQIQSDLRDRGSQIELPKTKDTGSQWQITTNEDRSSNIVPIQVTTEEFKLDDGTNSNISKSYSSFIEKSYSTFTEPQVDYSTTLIKDVTPHFEPVELIVQNRSLNNSTTYIKEIDNIRLNKLEPVKLILSKTQQQSTSTRSGSLPPSSRQKVRYSRYDYSDASVDDDVFYYYTGKSSADRERDAKVVYYKEVETKAVKPTFEPIELVLQPTYSHKRIRDLSLPSTKRIRVPLKQQQQQQNTYRYEYEDSSSDFISDSRQVQNTYYQIGSNNKSYSSEFEVENRKLPTVDMKLDLKVPPTIEMHLRDIDAVEEQDIRLDCVVSGKPTPTVKWYKDGKEIEQDNTNYLLHFDNETGFASLTIKRVNRNDAGRFTCVARNVLGSCATSSTVNVKGKYTLE